MVKLRSMTKARQIGAIQRHAQIDHSLRSVALSGAFESVGRQRPIRGRQPVSAQVWNWLAVVNRCQSLLPMGLQNAVIIFSSARMPSRRVLDGGLNSGNVVLEIKSFGTY
jgi:hypothetical protein